MNAMKAVVTVVGYDRTGIVYHISKVLYETGVNILDLSQTIMQDEMFTMIMMVDLANANCDFETLRRLLQEEGKTCGVEARIQNNEIFDAMHHI